MDKQTDTGLFNELSELIGLRMHFCMKVFHHADWVEHKTHMDYDLWFIQSGVLKIIINGTEHTANPGDVIFFYPDVPYTASSPSEDCQFIYVHFDFEIGSQQRILNAFQLSGIIPQERILEEAALFVKSFNASQELNYVPNNRFYIKACLMAVLAKIFEIHHQGQYIGTFLIENKSIESKKNLQVLQPALTYINQNLNNTIKIQQLAALTGMSEKYFIAYFKKSIGMTPGHYIYQVKMNRARDYLCQKKYTIQQIASFLGYFDTFAFSKAFKKYYSVAPSKFIP